MLDELKEDLVGIDIRFDEPLKRYTYTKVGGPADYLAFPRNRYELSRIVKFANKHDIPWMVLGNASNLIVRDGGIRGFVIMFDRLNGIAVNGYQIEAEAGANLIATTKVARFQSLTGFEFAAGIQGSDGGAVFMNAGAYGVEMNDVLKDVTLKTGEVEVRVIPAAELEMGYRTSIIKKAGYLVLGATISLKEGNLEEIKTLTRELSEKRTSKQPLEFPSAGSTFKRPEGYFAGKLIMDSGLRGYQVGGAQVSEKHCGFVINAGNATAEDVCRLMADVQRIVSEKFGVTLEPEVKFLGEF